MKYNFVIILIILISSCNLSTNNISNTDIYSYNKILDSLIDGKRNPLSELPEGMLAISNTKISYSTFSEVLPIFGNALLSRGKGAADPNILCYRSEDKKNDNTILIFESGPSGGWRIIDGIGLLKSDDSTYKECIPSPHVSSSLHFDSGFRIGMSEKELTAILKTPSAIKGEWQVYRYEGSRKIKGLDFTVNVYVFIRVVDSKVKEIWIRKYEFS